MYSTQGCIISRLWIIQIKLYYGLIQTIISWYIPRPVLATGIRLYRIHVEFHSIHVHVFTSRFTQFTVYSREFTCIPDTYTGIHTELPIRRYVIVNRGLAFAEKTLQKNIPMRHFVPQASRHSHTPQGLFSLSEARTAPCESPMQPSEAASSDPRMYIYKCEPMSQLSQRPAHCVLA